MKRRLVVFLVICAMFITGCQAKKYTAIPKKEDFIASVNILQPSIDFINKSGDLITTWSLDESYTGAVLVGKDRILLYGNQLEHADLVTLSTGELQQKIAVERGATFAYYDNATQQFFIANGEYNTVTAYDEKGNKKKEKVVGLYPMAMSANDDKLYIINFKDKYLSVLHTDTLEEINRIEIPKFSHGLDFINGEIWIGGHGAGEQPNTKVQRINVDTGKIKGSLELPSMPIAFTNLNGEEYVLSHGENTLSELDEKYKIAWKTEIGANPFAVNSFHSAVIVGGYDDRTLYWLENHKIVHKIKVGKGPFQILVREEN